MGLYRVKSRAKVRLADITDILLANVTCYQVQKGNINDILIANITSILL